MVSANRSTHDRHSKVRSGMIHPPKRGKPTPSSGTRQPRSYPPRHLPLATHRNREGSSDICGRGHVSSLPPNLKGAGAVYSRAISKCVSDADLSTGKFPAYPVVLSHRHSEKGAVSAGFPALGWACSRARRSETPCHASRCARISASWSRNSATRASVVASGSARLDRAGAAPPARSARHP